MQNTIDASHVRSHNPAGFNKSYLKCVHLRRHPYSHRHGEQVDLGARARNDNIGIAIVVEELGNVVPPVTCWERSQRDRGQLPGSHTEPTGKAVVVLQAGRIEEESFVRILSEGDADGRKAPLCNGPSACHPERDTGVCTLISARLNSQRPRTDLVVGVGEELLSSIEVTFPGPRLV